MPACGSLANVAAFVQLAPLAGPAAGQWAVAHPVLVQLQVCELVHVHVLHASSAKSSVMHVD